MAALVFGIGAAALGTLGSLVGAAMPSRGGGQQGGGNVTFGLEAETNDYCLTRAQLANSGIQVANSIFETLTVPNDKGVAVPYLAKSVTPNATFNQWTVVLRPGISFQDGEPFNAAAVKMNLDSYRGAPGAPNTGALFPIVLKFINDVTVVNPMTVQVTLTGPVPDFPAYLSSGGRLGMMAPAQLNGTGCSTKLIGTGPFKLQTYQQNQKTVVVRNPNYWQPGYPKVDSITFVPVPDGSARNVQFQGGQLDIIQQRNAQQISELHKLGGQIKVLTQPPGFREVNYYLLIAAKSPFNNQLARTAFAYAVNRPEINQIRNSGTFELANGVMDRSAPGYLKNAGYPTYNLKKAQALVDQVKAQNGGQFKITVGTDTDPNDSAEVQILKEQLGKAGIDAEIVQYDQATLINQALTRSIDVLTARNLHGTYSDYNDADTYPWFANASLGYLTNFSGYNDPVVQQLLDQGRQEPNLQKVRTIYQQLNRVLAQRGYLLPTWYVDWTVAYQPSVTVTFPPLPDGHGRARSTDGIVPPLGLSTKS